MSCAEDDLQIGDTRPAMAFGVPYTLAVPVGTIGVLIAFLIPGIKSLMWSAAFMVPIWVLARPLCSRDYNAPRVFLMWLDSAARDLRAGEWGGASIDPFPLRGSRRAR